MYKRARNKVIYSIEYAAEKLHIAPRTLSKYEAEGKVPVDVVVSMAKLYGNPELCYEHCKHQCPLGQIFHHHIEKKSLSSAVIQLHNAVTGLDEVIHMLMQMADDETITPNETEDCFKALARLNHIEHHIGEVKLSASDVIPIEDIMRNGPTAATASKSVQGH